MRSATVCCITFAFLFLLSAQGQTQAPQQASLAVGQVTIASIKGEVAIRAADGATMPTLRGQTLVPGTLIETRKGSLVLDLADGSQAQVKGNTRLVLKDATKDQGFSIELFLGKVLTKIKKRLGAEPSFRMGTPTAVITVRGTQFLTQVDKKGKTEVYVYEGVVEVAGLLPGSRPVFVRPGFWTDVPPHRPAREPSEIYLNRRSMRGASEDERWGSAASDRIGRDRSESGDRQQPSQQTEKDDD